MATTANTPPAAAAPAACGGHHHHTASAMPCAAFPWSAAQLHRLHTSWLAGGEGACTQRPPSHHCCHCHALSHLPLEPCSHRAMPMEPCGQLQKGSAGCSSSSWVVAAACELPPPPHPASCDTCLQSHYHLTATAAPCTAFLWPAAWLCGQALQAQLHGCMAPQPSGVIVEVVATMCKPASPRAAYV